MNEKKDIGMSRGAAAGRHPEGPSAGHPIPRIGEHEEGGMHQSPVAEAVVDHPGGRDVGAGAAGTAGMAGRERTERPGADDPGTSGGVGKAASGGATNRSDGRG